MKKLIPVLFCVIFLSPSCIHAQELINMAVFPINASADIDKANVKVVEDSLLYELRQLKNFEIVSIDEIQKVLNLEQQKQMLGCSDPSCLVNVAGALGVEKLVITNMGRAGNLYAVSIKLLNMESGYTEKQAYRNFESTSGSELLTIMKGMVWELFPEADRKEGYRQGTVSSSAGANKSISPFVWVAAGIGVAGLGTGIFGNVMLSKANSDKDTAKATGTYTKSEQEDIDSKGNMGAMLVNVGYSVAAAGALSAVLIYFLAGNNSPGSGGGLPQIYIAPCIDETVGLTLTGSF